MSTIIEIDEVNKVFATGEHAVKDLSLNIKEGEIIALLGPNGVPEKIENILRDETIETIIDSVNQKLELNSEVNQENISIFQNLFYLIEYLSGTLYYK